VQVRPRLRLVFGLEQMADGAEPVRVASRCSASSTQAADTYHCPAGQRLPETERNLPKQQAGWRSQAKASLRECSHAQKMAKIAIPRGLFRAILERIRRLRLPEAVPRRRQERAKSTGKAGRNGGGLSASGRKAVLAAADPVNTAPATGRTQGFRPEKGLHDHGNQRQSDCTGPRWSWVKVTWEMSAETGGWS